MRYLSIVLFMLFSSCCSFVEVKDRKIKASYFEKINSIKVTVSYNDYSETISEGDCSSNLKGKHLKKYACDIYKQLKSKNEEISLSSEKHDAELSLIISSPSKNKLWRMSNYLTLGIIPFWSTEHYEIEFLDKNNKKFSTKAEMLNVESIFLIPLMLYKNKNYALDKIFKQLN